MTGIVRGRLAQALLGAWLLGGCYTTTVTSGKPAARARIEYDEKWHSGVVWGIAELSGPYNLQQICPNGWAEIKTETSFLNGFVDAVTYGIYAPQTVSVRCAAGAPALAPAAAAPSSTPAPALEPTKPGETPPPAP
jgi:hypothetical protein